MRDRTSLIVLMVLGFCTNVWAVDTTGYSIGTTVSKLKPVGGRIDFQYLWTAPPGHSGSDNLRVHKVGAADNDFLRYQYIPSYGIAGTVGETLPSSVIPGEFYEIRLYAASGQRLVTSGPMQVVAASDPVPVGNGCLANP